MKEIYLFDQDLLKINLNKLAIELFFKRKDKAFFKKRIFRKIQNN